VPRRSKPTTRWNVTVRVGAKLAGLMLALVLTPLSLASPLDDRDTFVAGYRCDVAQRLAQIKAHAEGPDRFLVLELPSRLNHYVQCIFIDHDHSMLCEASSGFYAQKPGQPRRMRLSRPALEALRQLGFSTADGEGNFQRTIGAEGRDDLAAIAELMLAALYEGYGARPGMQIRVVAPFAKQGNLQTAMCAPVS